MPVFSVVCLIYFTLNEGKYCNNLFQFSGSLDTTTKCVPKTFLSTTFRQLVALSRFQTAVPRWECWRLVAQILWLSQRRNNTFCAPAILTKCLTKKLDNSSSMQDHRFPPAPILMSVIWQTAFACLPKK